MFVLSVQVLLIKYVLFEYSYRSNRFTPAAKIALIIPTFQLLLILPFVAFVAVVAVLLVIVFTVFFIVDFIDVVAVTKIN